MVMATSEWRFNLYRTCLHEAAHAEVAQRLGYAATHFRVWRLPAGPDGRMTFTGETYVFEEISDDHSRVICLAGAVAELLMDGVGEEVSEIHQWLARGAIGLSESDAAGADGFTEWHTRETVWLVQTCWTAIEAEVASTLTELGVGLSDGT